VPPKARRDRCAGNVTSPGYRRDKGEKCPERKSTRGSRRGIRTNGGSSVIASSSPACGQPALDETSPAMTVKVKPRANRV
jgi:hypothetical protein